MGFSAIGSGFDQVKPGGELNNVVDQVNTPLIQPAFTSTLHFPTYLQPIPTTYHLHLTYHTTYQLYHTTLGHKGSTNLNPK